MGTPHSLARVWLQGKTNCVTLNLQDLHWTSTDKVSWETHAMWPPSVKMTVGDASGTQMMTPCLGNRPHQCQCYAIMVSPFQKAREPPSLPALPEGDTHSCNTSAHLTNEDTPEKKFILHSEGRTSEPLSNALRFADRGCHSDLAFNHFLDDQFTIRFFRYGHARRLQCKLETLQNHWEYIENKGKHIARQRIYSYYCKLMFVRPLSMSIRGQHQCLYACRFGIDMRVLMHLYMHVLSSLYTLLIKLFLNGFGRVMSGSPLVL